MNARSANNDRREAFNLSPRHPGIKRLHGNERLFLFGIRQHAVA
jgi:hypothetical protein